MGITDLVANDRLQERLEAALESGIRNGIPGLSIAISDSRTLVWSGAAGWNSLEDRKPLEVNDLLGIGSITKSFVAHRILQLSERGQLDLDHTPAQILGPDIVRDIANADTATVLQLLNHTSGIPSWEFDAEWIRDARGANQTTDRHWSKTEVLEYLRDGNPADGPPGAAFHYSNTNYTLLGLIIEEITGRSLQQELSTHYFVPLDMGSTHLDGFQDYPAAARANGYHLATPYFLGTAGRHPSFTSVPGGLINTHKSTLSYEWAAGGLVSTAPDLVKFARAGLNGWGLGRDSEALRLDFRPTGIDGVEVGHGLFRVHHPDLNGPVIQHGGDVLGYSALMGWFEGGHVAWAILSNQGSMHSFEEDSSGLYRLKDFFYRSGLIEILNELNEP